MAGEAAAALRFDVMAATWVAARGLRFGVAVGEEGVFRAMSGSRDSQRGALYELGTMRCQCQRWRRLARTRAARCAMPRSARACALRLDVLSLSARARCALCVAVDVVLCSGVAFRCHWRLLLLTVPFFFFRFTVNSR